MNTLFKTKYKIICSSPQETPGPLVLAYLQRECKSQGHLQLSCKSQQERAAKSRLKKRNVKKWKLILINFYSINHNPKHPKNPSVVAWLCACMRVCIFTHSIAVHQKDPEWLSTLIFKTEEEGIVSIEVMCSLWGRQMERWMRGDREKVGSGRLIETELNVRFHSLQGLQKHTCVGSTR